MNTINLASAVSAKPVPPPAKHADNPALRKAFDEFVGETFYGQMIKSMRKSQGEVAYFGGGQAEEIFTQQLDQALDQEDDPYRCQQAQRPDVPAFHAGTKVNRSCQAPRT